MARAVISKRTVTAFEPPQSGEARLWDATLAGFCVRAYAISPKYPRGRKVFALKYRVDGRQRWLTIGEFSDAMTPDQARDIAAQALHDAKKGIDPAQVKRDRREAGTVSDLIDRYLTEGPDTRPAKRASSWAADKAQLNHHVRPLLGDRPVDGLTKSMVAKLVRDVASGQTRRDPQKGKARGVVAVKGGPATADRTRASLSAMYGWAVEHGLASANPCLGVKVAKLAARERFLSTAEAVTLFDKLKALETGGKVPREHADIIRLLLLTGARRSEIAGLRWSEVDLERRRLILPPERTKAGGKTGDRRIHLSTAAMMILGAIKPRPKCSYVFPSVRGDAPTNNLQKSWSKVREAAGLADVRLHDLRHSFASFAASDGASLLVIQRALGHADSRTTQRYSHLADATVAEMVERAAERMLVE